MARWGWLAIVVGLGWAAAAQAEGFEPVSRKQGASVSDPIYHDGRWWDWGTAESLDVGPVYGRYEKPVVPYPSGSSGAWANTITTVTVEQVMANCYVQAGYMAGGTAWADVTFDVARRMLVRCEAQYGASMLEMATLRQEPSQTVIWNGLDYPGNPGEVWLEPGRYTASVSTITGVELTLTAVPEPATGLVLVALAGLVGRRRRA